MTKDEIITLQSKLNDHGYNLAVDGVYGPKTEQAYAAYLDRDPQVPTLVPPAVKPWWQSRAVLGLLATILVGLARRYGIEVDRGGLTDVLLQVAEVAGVALAFYGTVKRSAPIDPSLVAPGLRVTALAAPVSAPSQPADRDSPGPFGY